MKSNKRSTKLILLAILLLIFATLKVSLVMWWQKNQLTHTTVAQSCDVTHSGCEFQAGQTLKLIGVGNNKTPFAAQITGLPEHTQSVTLSFAMKDMDMGFNRFELHKQHDGSWKIEQIYLPLCSENRHDWQVKWQVDGQSFQADFQTQ